MPWGPRGVVVPSWVPKSRKELVNSSFIASNGGSIDDRQATTVTTDSFMRRIMINPFSRYRVAWDLAGAFLICYDMIMIPMQAFELSDTGFLKFMLWTITLFW